MQRTQICRTSIRPRAKSRNPIWLRRPGKACCPPYHRMLEATWCVLIIASIRPRFTYPTLRQGGVFTSVSGLFKTATGSTQRAEKKARATKTSPADVVRRLDCQLGDSSFNLITVDLLEWMQGFADECRHSRSWPIHGRHELREYPFPSMAMEICRLIHS